VYRFDGVEVRLEAGRDAGTELHVGTHAGVFEDGLVGLGALPLRVIDDPGAVGADVDFSSVAARSSSASSAARSGSTVKTLIKVTCGACSWIVVIVRNFLCCQEPYIDHPSIV
jgi:hypothetical protein